MIKSDQKIDEAVPIKPIETAHQKKDNSFRIYNKVEICAILQNIMQRNALVTVYFDQGNHFILTSILAVDPSNNEMIADYGIDEKLNEKLLNAKRITFVTSQDRVKVEFTCNTIKKIPFEGNDAFLFNVPDSLLRMQRRNYFRIATPTVNPLKCVIPLSADVESDTAEVTLLDISCGGIAVIDHHPSVSFDPGGFFENCSISLPSMGIITADIEVKNTYEVTLRNGLACKRAGCEFVNPPAKNFALIQRYITKLEQIQKTTNN